MQFKRNIKPEYGLGPMTIVSLVNLVFLLLIFFMLLPSFTSEAGIDVKLPKAVTSSVVKEENLVVTVTSENVIYLNGRITTLKELSQSLASVPQKNNSVLIRADRRASVGRVVDVWDLCRNLEIEQINIATNQSN